MKKDKKIERQGFLDVYTEFTQWLNILGFRSAHYWKEGSTILDYNWTYYDEYIDSLYGVECFIHDIIKLEIRFLRDRNEHKFMFVYSFVDTSSIYSIEDGKELILNEVRRLRDEQLSKLSVMENL